MRRTLGLSLLAVLASLPASANVTVRTLNQQYAATAAQKVHLDFPVGSLEIEAVDGDRVKLEVRLECKRAGSSRCEDLAREIGLTADSSGGRLHLHLTGWPHMSGHSLEARVHAEVPRHLSLKAELGVGQMTIHGGAGDLDADLGVGDARIQRDSGDVDLDVGVGHGDIRMPQGSVRTVALESGMGDAHLRTPDKSYKGSGFLGRSLKWRDGRGPARIHGECGVGEIQAQLE